GALWALLLVRVVLRLFAARPDNWFVEALYAVSSPLVAPLAFLDAGQPRFGAVLELSTLALLVLIPVGYLLWQLVRRRTSGEGAE
ncbi:MAG: YggT family protein, partial [Chloroflexales bacterium]|nr:YggT family protein [Chloroflexales bacterium]